MSINRNSHFRHKIPYSVHEAFLCFASDVSLFALPLVLSNTTLQALPPISSPEGEHHTFQQALNQLDPILNTKIPLYLVLHREEGFDAITYVPYLGDAKTKSLLLDSRGSLLKTLGEEHFSSSIICKEIGEIIDARSWDERSGKGESWGVERDEHADTCMKDGTGEGGIQDLGHKRNKCRLCDRRMKNKIEDNALDALKDLADVGNCVQLSVDVSTEVLQLNFRSKDLTPIDVASHLPTDKPSFTFYRHVTDNRLYFIFCSPDSANVKERMKHTMAIPGLINITTKDNGVNVDQKLEIHDADELDFEKKDTRIGKFRSMYLRNEFAGTESQWEGMGEQQKILDEVR
ncbi:Twinfilin-1 [Kalmusia sp. IMI 367209]|nr:Twinfilin-1 [Kalmusia sp. IMI 367209]